MWIEVGGVRIEIKGVKWVRRAEGGFYLYWRKTGEQLPDKDPVALVQRIAELREERKPQPPGYGTWSSLIRVYRDSPEYREKAPLTLRDYERHLTAIDRVWGRSRVKDTAAPALIAHRNKLASKPRKANYRMQVFSLLFGFGAFVDPNQFGKANPVNMRRMKLKQGPGYSPWPENVIDDFDKAAYKELRWVVGAALETCQRGQDVIRLAWTHWHGEGIEVFTQKKTKAMLAIPASDRLKQIVAELPRTDLVMFTTKTGKPWTEGNLRNEVRKTLKKCGHTGYGLHGLRFKGARRLRLLGCGPDIIGALTGHATERMVREYSEREERASEAVVHLNRAQDKNG